jgi:hypothetical protein
MVAAAPGVLVGAPSYISFHLEFLHIKKYTKIDNSLQHVIKCNQMSASLEICVKNQLKFHLQLDGTCMQQDFTAVKSV